MERLGEEWSYINQRGGFSQGNMGLAEPTMYTTTSNVYMASAPRGSLSYSGETLGKLMASARR
jgi:hypothetical protein